MAERTLTVRGLGKISLPPDQIVMDFTVESKDANYNTVTDKQSEKTEELKNAITELGFDVTKLKTSNLNVSVEYGNFQNEKGVWERKFAGYKCTHHLSVKFDYDTEKLKWLLSAVTSCKKADPVFNISFSVKNSDETTEKLLEAAVGDAVKKALVISNAAGLVLGDVISINYDGESGIFRSPTVVYSSTPRGVDGEAELTSDISVEPENISSQLEVTVVWEIMS